MRRRCFLPLLLTTGCFAVLFASLAVSAQNQIEKKAKSAPREKVNRSTASDGSETIQINQEDKLFARHKSASVRITVKQHGITVSSGLGFFISRDGLLATNFRLMRHLLTQDGFSAEFTLPDKKIVREFRVANCSDKRGLDLCILKLEVESKFFLMPSKDPLIPGDVVHLIGPELQVVKAEVKEAGQNSSGVDEIEIMGPIHQGFVGGPILDKTGRLAGLLVRYVIDESKNGVGVSALEINDYRDSNLDFNSIALAKKKIKTSQSQDLKSQNTSALKNAMEMANIGKPIENLPGITEVSFDFEEFVIKAHLPEQFSYCKKAKTADRIEFNCPGRSQSTLFSFHLLDRKSIDTLSQPNPVTSIEKLIEAKSWSAVSAKLTAAQKRSFFSQPETSKCTQLPNTKLSGGVFSGSPYCRLNIKNDREPGASSLVKWAEVEPYVFMVRLWAEEELLLNHYSQVPTLALLTARSEKQFKKVPVPSVAIQSPPVVVDNPPKRKVAGQAPDKPMSGYELKLPDGISFMSARLDRQNVRYDVFGKKPVFGKFRDDYVLAVSIHKQILLPPVYQTFVMDAAWNASRILGFSPNNASIEIEPIIVDGKASRLLSVFGKDNNGEESLALVAAIYDDQRAFVIIQISDAKDPVSSFREFKEFLSAFKRK